MKHKALPEEQLVSLDAEFSQRAIVRLRERLHGPHMPRHRQIGPADLPSNRETTRMFTARKQEVFDFATALERWKHDREGKD